MTLRFIVARILRELIELAERDADAVDALHDALDVASPAGRLQAAVDLVRAEQDDAVGRGGRHRGAQVLDGAGEGAGEQPQVLGYQHDSCRNTL